MCCVGGREWKAVKGHFAAVYYTCDLLYVGLMDSPQINKKRKVESTEGNESPTSQSSTSSFYSSDSMASASHLLQNRDAPDCECLCVCVCHKVITF